MKLEEIKNRTKEATHYRRHSGMMTAIRPPSLLRLRSVEAHSTRELAQDSHIACSCSLCHLRGHRLSVSTQSSKDLKRHFLGPLVAVPGRPDA